jgi:hypothetical protein
LPQIHLGYDWAQQCLTGVTEKNHGYIISILTPEREPAIADWRITGIESTFKGDIKSLETLLKNGSLVKIRGHNSRSNEIFPEHRVLLQQTAWSHKPLDLPNLTPEQILAIYAGMSAERRQLLLVNSTIRKLILEGAAGEMTVRDDDLTVENFFSEYAEIFYAFRKLKEQLQENCDNENWVRLDYYLSGTGMDSLPALIAQATGEEKAGGSVTVYLLLLCCKEIFQDSQFKDRIKCADQLIAINRELRSIRTGDSIKLEDDSPDKRRIFFRWFEDQFFKEYKKAEKKVRG